MNLVIDPTGHLVIRSFNDEMTRLPNDQILQRVPVVNALFAGI